MSAPYQPVSMGRSIAGSFVVVLMGGWGYDITDCDAEHTYKTDFPMKFLAIGHFS